MWRRNTLYSGFCLATIVAQTLTVTSESIDKDESLSLLYETNTKLCDKIEVFDAIAANGSAEGTRTDTKATTIGQLRLQLEIEDQRLRSQGATTGQLRRQLETEDQRRRSQGGKKIQVDHTQSPNVST